MERTKFARRATRAWRLRRPRHIGSSYDSLKLLALHHARLLSRSGAAAFGRGTADDAACGRAGASGAAAAFLSMRVCRRSRAVRLPSGLRVLFSQLLFCLHPVFWFVYGSSIGPIIGSVHKVIEDLPKNQSFGSRIMIIGNLSVGAANRLAPCGLRATRG